MDKRITIQNPKVQKVLVHAEQMHWGALIEYRGTEADLIAAGVAQPYFFENIGKSGRRLRSDEFGDRYQIARLQRGIWTLVLYHHESPSRRSSYRDVTDDRAVKCKWYPEARAAVDEVVDAILARLISA